MDYITVRVTEPNGVSYGQRMVRGELTGIASTSQESGEYVTMYLKGTHSLHKSPLDTFEIGVPVGIDSRTNLVTSDLNDNVEPIGYVVSDSVDTVDVTLATVNGGSVGASKISEVSRKPRPDGNTENLGEYVTVGLGDVYYIDTVGKSILIRRFSIRETKPRLENDFKDYGGHYRGLTYRVDDGVLYVQGLIKNDHDANGRVIFQLPSDISRLISKGDIIFDNLNTSNTKTGRITYQQRDGAFILTKAAVTSGKITWVAIDITIPLNIG